MKLLPRLFLMGAVAPTIAAAAVSSAVVALFVDALDDELDRALLAQAAVESVSLFDGPEGLHLHMTTSPLLEDVRRFAPEAAVYDEGGERRLAFPVTTSLPLTWPGLPTMAVGHPTLKDGLDGATRRLAVAVQDPHSAKRSLLVLSATRAGVIHTRSTLIKLVVGSVVCIFVVMSALTLGWARRLHRRVALLMTHQARVAHGDLDAAPEADDADDELSSLRDTIAETTAELAAQRRARERFLADAAHELRTPLASMRLGLDLALRRAARDDASVDAHRQLIAALEDARGETTRLTALAQGLLEVTAARSAPLVRADEDLVAIAGAAVASASAAASTKGLRLNLIEDGAVTARVDAPSVRRAIDNLIDNAIKHARGEVVVTVDREGDAVVVSVDDDGPGIPVDKRDVVFQPFHRLGHAGSGVGLGLALVREVAQRHGGSAQVREGPAACRLQLRLPNR